MAKADGDVVRPPHHHSGLSHSDCMTMQEAYMQDRIPDRRLVQITYPVERRKNSRRYEDCLNATLCLCRMALEDCREARSHHDSPNARRHLLKAKAYREILLSGWPW